MIEKLVKLWIAVVGLAFILLVAIGTIVLVSSFFYLQDNTTLLDWTKVNIFLRK